EAHLTPHHPAFLAHHRIQATAVFPATAYVEIALAAGTVVLKTNTLRLRTVALTHALVWADGTPRTLQTILQKDGDGARFQIFSAPSNAADPLEDTPWTLHCEGAIAPVETPTTPPTDLTALQQWLTEGRSPDIHYQICHRLGLDYGPSFRILEQIWRRDGEALGLVQCPDALLSEPGFDRLHPAILDACCQVIFAALPDVAQGDTYLPMGIDCLRFDRLQPGTRLWSHVKLHPWGEPRPPVITADVRILDGAGQLVALISGLSVKRVSPDAVLGRSLAGAEPSSPPWTEWLYRMDWCPLPPLPTPAIASGHWLILADEGGLAAALAQHLTDCGHRATLVRLGDRYAQTGDRFQLNPHQPDGFCQLLRAMQANYGASAPVLSGIVSFWGIDAGFQTADLADDLTDDLAADSAPAALPDGLQRGCETTLYLVQAIASRWQSSSRPRLWLVTWGAQAVREGDEVQVAQRPLWGLGQVIALEHPELGCVRVDLDPAHPQGAVQLLAAELGDRPPVVPGTHYGEDQIAFRQGIRYGARLVGDRALPAAQHLSSQSDRIPLQLQIQHQGTLENLIWQPHARRSPGPDEVEIQVHATGLNFRDVMNALGLYPGEAGALGLECVGQIAAVGSAVQTVHPGDWVMAIAPGSFSQFVTVPAAWVTPKPAALSPEEAATVPVAFLTAAYALGLEEPTPQTLQKGQRILIHAAAGGVGQAAVQLAQRAGAEVFATASPGKWAFLKAQGVTHVMNSRSLDFADEILRITEGQGVDFVLNALSGDFISKSLAVLKPGGCFVEIGKAGIWTTAEMHQQRPDVTYKILDLLDFTHRYPDRIQAALVNLARQFDQQFDQKELRSLHHQTFAADRAIDAFRTLQQAQHIGKVVIKAPAASPQQPTPSPAIHANATYLITGGLGALGLQLAQWLVHQGARHLLLLGRRPPSSEARSILEHLQSQGVALQILQANVADFKALKTALTPYLPLHPPTHPPIHSSPPPPLKGIFHLAGQLDDGTLQQQTWERFAAVMAAKVQGTWHLHQLTRKLALDHFVLFSSAASLIGSAGQGNYAAANAFLDAIAHHRHALQLPALSINWGAWSGEGLANRDPVRQRLQQTGMAPLDPQQGFEVLAHLLGQPSPQVGVLPADGTQGLGGLFQKGALLSEEPSSTASTNWRQRLQGMAAGDRLPHIQTHLREQVAIVLGISPTQLTDPHQGLTDLGLDSLTAVELRNRLQTSLEQPLPATLVYDYPTLADLTRYVATTFFGACFNDGAIAADASPSPIASSTSRSGKPSNLAAIDLENLSEAEAEALLLEELERLEGA
ncbi:MAG: SDR family NAD(P)-dependent oxidoreductase, partial [Synechococcales bacterium]|nr:SDR family NAD(P)-dependent oxidoreductase [Synechococcales bacterium]